MVLPPGVEFEGDYDPTQAVLQESRSESVILNALWVAKEKQMELDDVLEVIRETSLSLY